jgi:hypothetical protein
VATPGQEATLITYSLTVMTQIKCWILVPIAGQTAKVTLCFRNVTTLILS